MRKLYLIRHLGFSDQFNKWKDITAVFSTFSNHINNNVEIIDAYITSCITSFDNNNNNNNNDDDDDINYDSISNIASNDINNNSFDNNNNNSFSSERRPIPAATLSTDSVGPVRFVGAHGRRSAILGYPQNGLEIWAWPFQILSGYRIGIRTQGAATEVNGDLLLRRIEYDPDAVTPIYIGPDFVVCEKLFVPLDLAGAIITYTVEGRVTWR